MDVGDVPAVGHAELDEGVGDLAGGVFGEVEVGGVRHGSKQGLQATQGALHGGLTEEAEAERGRASAGGEDDYLVSLTPCLRLVRRNVMSSAKTCVEVVP